MKTYLPGLALTLLLAITAFAYQPGLSGGFLFDDNSNLPALGAYGPIDNSTALLRYLTSGTADPTGRPVALASFLIDARNWPADAYPFKRTNLLLHLLNGLLLAWLLCKLGREHGLSEQHNNWAAALGAGFWLLHPLFVSTTLYVVQREAMLPATFTLLGLIGYVTGRQMLLAGAIWRGGLLAALCMGFATLLAILSKANGVLLPVLALTLEITVLRPPSSTPKASLNALRGAVLLLPTCLLLAYLIQLIPSDWNAIPGGRPWSHAQRLLTQPRVLVDYLGLLWLPQPYTAGLFNDNFAASTGLLKPWTTLAALLLIVSLLFGAVIFRRRFPLVAAALLFYFAGQILESSIIALELYFEHRNYLPTLLMFWPLACWLTAPGNQWKLKTVLAATVLIMLTSMTYLRSGLWGDTTDQALLWAQLNPGSPRANAYAAQLEMQEGRPADAEQRLQRGLVTNPDEPQLTINLIGVHCQLGGLADDDLDKVAHSLRTTRTGTGLLFKWFAQAVDTAKRGTCPGLDFAALEELIKAAWQNPGIADIAGRLQDLLHLQGVIALAQGHATAALKQFDAALLEDIKPAIALKQAAALGSAGFPCAGLAHLDQLAQVRDEWANPSGHSMATFHAQLLLRQGYWRDEIEHIQATLRADALSSGDSACDEYQRPQNQLSGNAENLGR